MSTANLRLYRTRQAAFGEGLGELMDRIHGPVLSGMAENCFGEKQDARMK